VQAVLGVVGRSLPPSPRAYRGCRISHAGQPRISNFSLDEVFRNEVINHGLDPDYTWINGYLPIIWEKDRYYIEAFLGDIAGKIGLELGCNVGATAIMLSRLGARVTAVDVDKRYVAIAERNAARYGEEKIQFRWVPAAAALPFPAGSFDFVTCASVLEYVSPQHLPALIREIDRVLIAGGVLVVLGTSNRLAPREVHSRAWLSNYIPRRWDRLLQPRRRGIFPWQITKMLTGYADLVTNDRKRYFNVRRKTGDSPPKIVALRTIALAGRFLGLSCGAVTPSFFLALKKPDLQTTGEHKDARVAHNC
jgi:ubiquinone/menaquinone biosynthesis C-methylase UbiE